MLSSFLKAVCDVGEMSASESQDLLRVQARRAFLRPAMYSEHAYACYCDAEGTESAQHSLNEFTSMLLVQWAGLVWRNGHISQAKLYLRRESQHEVCLF